MAFIGNLWRLGLLIHFFQSDRAVLTHWRDAIFWRVIFSCTSLPSAENHTPSATGIPTLKESAPCPRAPRFC